MEAQLAADIWCGEVKTPLEAAADPQVGHLGLIETVRHPTAGEVRVGGPAVRLSETPPTIHRPASLVGKPAREVLFALGRSEAEMDAVIERGVAGTPPAS